MKHFLTVICLLFAFSAFGQTWQPNGTKYPNATNQGDTATVQSRIPMIDKNGLLNYYLPISDIIALNPVPAVTWETITGNQGSVNISGFNNDAGYISSYTETDPTVANHVKSITTGDINTWNSALQAGDNLSELTDDIGITTQAENDARYVSLTLAQDVAGTKKLISPGRLDFEGLVPQIRFTQTDGATNEKNYITIADGSRYDIRLYNDSFSSFNSVFQINRSGTTASSIVLNATNTNVSGGLTVNSNIVYHQANHRSDSQNDARYIRRDINDNNGVNTLTLGGLMLPSIPVGVSTYDHLVVNPTTGEVGRVNLGTFTFDVGNGSTTQFTVDSTTPELNFVGSGDTSVSFNGSTNTVTITSTPGAGGGGAVTSFEGRDGAVVSVVGDYDTNEVVEAGNLYFTEGRVRSTTLTGLSVTNTPITSTNNFLQALGRLQGQINNREPSFSKNTAFNKNFGTSSGTVLQGNWRPSWGDITGTNPSYTKSESDNRYVNVSGDTMTGDLMVTRDNIAVVEITGLDSSGGIVGTDTNHDFVLRRNNAEIIRLLSTGANITGDLSVAGVISATGGNSTNWNTAFGWGNHANAGYVPNSRLISAGLHLSGGGDLTANRTLTLTPTVDQWVLDSQGKERMYFSSGIGSNGIILKASSSTQQLQYRDANNNQVFTVDDTGNVNASGDVTASNLLVGSSPVWHSGNLRSNAQNDARYALQTTAITAGAGLTGGGNLSANRTFNVGAGTGITVNGNDVAITNIAAGSSTVGAIRYNGTVKSSGGFYGGSSNPTNTTRLNYDGNLHVNNLIAQGGSFNGRVSGADAVNPDEFVTRQQVAPIAASGSGLARLAGANTAMVYNDPTNIYFKEGGTIFNVDIPAGTFSQNVHLGAITIELNASLTYTGSSTTGTEDYSMDIVFMQGATTQRIPFYVTSIPRDSKLGYVTYKMTAISRSSGGLFMISGGGNQYPAGQPFMEYTTLNIDARQAFSIRLRKGSVGSDSNMDVEVSSFVVTTMDGGAQ